MEHRRLIFAAVLLSLGLVAHAADTAKEDLLVPPPPAKLQSGEPIEPEVTIIQKKDATEERYSINGQVYAVKITPVGGPAYYLIDSDGDGSLETTQDDIERGLNVPQWILFSW
ncbi:MAG: DUF2782 domain-containing protein [Sulfuriflexus sp.]|nr:DUF2782 domain-containing protein [Sulfuriflexus sp.]